MVHLGPMVVVVSLFAKLNERRAGMSPSLQSASGGTQIPYFFHHKHVKIDGFEAIVSTLEVVQIHQNLML